jgi:hypothetical protein
LNFCPHRCRCWTVQSSYRKAGTKVAYDSDLSKQAVMKKVHEIEVVDAPLPNAEVVDCQQKTS